VRDRRDHLRALARCVEVDTKEIRIMGANSVLLRTLNRTKTALDFPPRSGLIGYNCARTIEGRICDGASV
jgi:hypothetical protein